MWEVRPPPAPDLPQLPRPPFLHAVLSTPADRTGACRLSSLSARPSPVNRRRRCDERIVCAVRTARFDAREYEGAVELPGEIRSAVGILHGQGKPFSDGRKAQAGRTWSGEGCRGDAADANRTCVAGTGDRLDCSAFCSGQREGGEEFRNGTGSAGEGDAGGWSDDDRAGQPISDQRLSGVVGAGADGGSG